MKDADSVMIIGESLVKSIASDVITFLTVVGIIGVGRCLDSPAMQWCGFLMLCLTAIARANKGQITPQAAADLLLKRYGVVGRPS